MTDRELLEMAAKAAGYSLTKGSAGYREFLCKGGVEWNPLEDDGDALRLAVDLRIDVYPWISKEDPSSSVMARNAHGFRTIEFVSKNRGCRHAATRRAIVSAATEIGRVKT